MQYEGPLPDEALPVGEEPLTPEEVGRLAACMFELDEKTLEHFPDRITEADVTPEQWAAKQKVGQDLKNEAFESLKQGLIEHRE
ncbi:MAG TPA: hypothetical protein VFN51_03025 [Candidatus Saccharimonadales bacterium]|nr:hypothetical protein [Candidatus Saccharimonadales bacterium]